MSGRTYSIIRMPRTVDGFPSISRASGRCRVQALLAHNAACHIDRLYLEFHPPDPRDRRVEAEWRREVEEFAMRALGTPPCKTVASVMDDETFLLDGKPLPEGRICPALNRTVVGGARVP